MLMFLAVALIAVVAARVRAGKKQEEANLQKQLQTQNGLLAEMTLEHARMVAALSNRISQLSTEKSELICLRGEVSQLRREAADPEKLLAKIEDLKREAAGLTNKSAEETPLPDAEKVRAYWPKAQLVFAGTRDERSAVQTALWALNSGDPQKIEAISTAEVAKSFAGTEKGADPLLRQSNLFRLANSLGPAKGFYMVSDNLGPRIAGFNPRRVMFKVYFEGEGAARVFGFDKVDDELKFAGVYLVRGADEHPTEVLNLWP